MCRNGAKFRDILHFLSERWPGLGDHLLSVMSRNKYS